jgi:hypothetical protein
MTEEEKKAARKQKQAIAHKKWRESEKGKAYYQRKKEQQILGKAAVESV